MVLTAWGQLAKDLKTRVNTIVVIHSTCVSRHGGGLAIKCTMKTTLEVIEQSYK